MLGLDFWIGLLLGSVAVAVAFQLRRASARRNRATDGQAYLRAIVETAPDAIVAIKADGTIDWANRAAVGVFGCEHERLMGSPIAQILPSFGGRDIAAWMAEYGISGRVAAYEAQGQRVDGTPFPCTVSAGSVLVKGVQHFTFVVRDASDSKWAENELRLREAALDSAGDGVVISSMTLPGEPIIYANPAFLRMSGYSLEEIIGVNCRFLQGTEQDQQPVAEIRRAISESRGCRVILRNYRKDGSLFWNLLTLSPVFSPEGSVTHYVGVQSDITSRMEQEAALQVRTDRLNTVFDLSPDGFVAVDAEGIVRIMNPAFAAMTGFQPRELIGQPVGLLEAALAGILSHIEEMEEPDTSLVHLKAPTPLTMLRRVRHSGDSVGSQEVVMYFRDMTRELEVDRMKSEFLSMAAHELRTPMASIFGFTELLLKRNFDEERRKDLLQTIHRQSKLLINLVNELLDLARIEARRGRDFQRRVQPLAPIVARMLDGLLVHGDSRQVALTLPERDILIDVDEGKLALALTNVVSNAYKYSARDQGIELSLVERERDGHDQVGVQVRDHGIGMTPDQRARVFERFFRADTSGNIPGTGLGLTIVKEIVELHGGSVEIDSVYHEGTVATLWLPRVAADDPRCAVAGDLRALESVAS